MYKISKTLAVVASSSVATGGVLGPVRPVTCPLHSRVVGQSSQSSSSLSPGCKLSVLTPTSLQEDDHGSELDHVDQ